LILIEAILIIQPPIMLKKMKTSTLTLTDESLERTSGKFTEKVNYADIQRMEVVEKSSGKIAYIQVRSSSRKTLYINGFEGMEDIVQQLEQRLPDKSQALRKRPAIDWSSSVLQIGIVAVSVIVILLIQRLGQYAYNVFNMLLLFAVGLYSLIYRPITKSAGKRFALFEIITGSVLVFCALVMAGILLFVVIQSY
jgi:hypothetical protein